MKKLLVFSLLLLSGCATEIPVSKRYDIQTPREKASLAIELYPNQIGNDPLDFDSVQQTWQKYFVKADPKNADFVLKETSWMKDCSVSGWTLLSSVTAAIIPSWGKQKCTYTYSLTRRENGKMIFLSDVKGESRIYVGWLFLPAFLFPDMIIDGSNTVSRAPAMVSAIEEAASLVYNKNSRLYQQKARKNWGEATATTPSQFSAPVAAPTISTPEDMDAAW